MKALQRRAERRARGGSMVDLNLVSLIDVFTILIFFLLANAAEVQTLSTPRGVRLPEAHAEQAPREGIELAVSGRQVLLQGRPVAELSDATGDGGLAPLRAALHERVVQRAQDPQTPPAPLPLVVVADRDLPYRWLRALISTAAEVGLTEVSLAVRRKDGP
jgi:biopolymer transport protein TolR